MKVTVDPDLCEANALCVAAAPEVFDLVDDDVVDILLSGAAARDGVGRARCSDRLSEAGITDSRGLIRRSIAATLVHTKIAVFELIVLL